MRVVTPPSATPMHVAAFCQGRSAVCRTGAGNSEPRAARGRARHVTTLVAALAAVAAQTAAALETARMRLPAEFASGAERLEAAGFGGRQRGDYRLGPFDGEFVRIESRWSLADSIFAASQGRSSYSLQGPGFDAPVAAECEMSQRSVTLGIVTFDPDKMSYQCAFTQAGESIDAVLVLGEAPRRGLRARLLAASARHGEAAIDGIRLAIRSEHGYAGSRLTSPTPVGYTFYDVATPGVDSPGDLVAALELTDTEPTILIGTSEPRLRRAALIAAMALAVLRDPAESPLADD